MRNGYGDGADKAHNAMKDFLKSWNPIGHSTAELKSIFGNGYVLRDDTITYYFDTGNDTTFIRFVMENDRVSAVKRLGDHLPLK